MKKILIKIGTNVLTKENGELDQATMKNIVDQLCALKKEGKEIILVSSGAMGAGRTLIKLKNSKSVVQRQILSAVGQVKLMQKYQELFAKHGYLCAQVLATKEDFRDRSHYTNMRDCFSALLHDQIIPIVNENDVVSVSELMFTDNDELAGLIASMMKVEKVIILTSVDGIFDKNPSEKDAKIITSINSKDLRFKKHITPDKSSFGRGGMLTKADVALKLAKLGIETQILNGKTKDILLDSIGKGTTFHADKKSSGMKNWIAHSKGQEKGKIHLNEGAADIISSKNKAVSILPIGITKIEGEFKKGDVLEIFDHSGQSLGLGMASYSSKKARACLGHKNQKALVHYNYLYLNS